MAGAAPHFDPSGRLKVSTAGGVAGGGDMLGANNLSDVASAATSRTNLGLGSAAVKDSGAASGVASLNASTKVVEDPANATATPAASKIPIADGAGKLDTADVATYAAWLADKDPKNVQVWLGTAGYWSGTFHLTGFEVTGDRGGLAEVSITLESDGAVPYYTAA